MHVRGVILLDNIIVNATTGNIKEINANVCCRAKVKFQQIEKKISKLIIVDINVKYRLNFNQPNYGALD